MTAGGGRRDRLKRRADENDAHGHAGSIRKKRNSSALAVHGKERLRDSVSIRELAKPYLLAVGRLPIDVLDTRWSAGRNRTIEPVHVRELREAFRTNGLERREPRNRLLCLCSADAVRRARESARESAPTDRQSSGSDDEIEMLNWAEVNSGLVEVMAGQHRIAALREYVRDSGSQADELWWTCELYDQDRLPRPLAMRMRLNRTDLTMPDSHGQIWMQLVSIAENDADGDVIGSNSDGRSPPMVDHKLAESLWLGSEQRFPTRRLVTLWYHKRWREMATRWCQTRMGIGSFSISMFEWLASHRIDEYWFGLLGSTLDALQALPVDTSVHVTDVDWDRLVAAFGHKERTVVDAESVFYKSRGGQRRRVAGLLSTLSDDEYARLCTFIVDRPTMSFPAPHRIKRAYMQYMAHVMYHIIAWFDPPSAGAASAQAHTMQNKTLLRTHLETALERYASAYHSTASASVHTWGSAALHLQKLVLDFTRENADEFHDCAVRPAALGPKHDVNDPSYVERFRHGVWSRLLLLVRGEAASLGLGGVLRNEWKATFDGTKQSRVEEDTHGSASWSESVQIPELIHDFCSHIARAAVWKTEATNMSPRSAAELERSIHEAVEKTITAFLPSTTPRPSSSPTTRTVAIGRSSSAGGRRSASPSGSLVAIDAATADGDRLPETGRGRTSLPEAPSASKESHPDAAIHTTTATNSPRATTPGDGDGAGWGSADRGYAARISRHHNKRRPGSFPTVTSGPTGSSSSPPPPQPPPSAQKPSQPSYSYSKDPVSPRAIVHGTLPSLRATATVVSSGTGIKNSSNSSSISSTRSKRPRWAQGPRATQGK